MRTIRTSEKRDAFLAALEATGNVTKSCEMAGLGRRAAYDWRRDDEEFRAAWEAANETGTDALEDEALRRAVAGGSDTLLIFMLKGRRPEKFKDRVSTEISGSLELQRAREQVGALPSEKLEAIAAILDGER